MDLIFNLPETKDVSSKRYFKDTVDALCRTSWLFCTAQRGCIPFKVGSNACRKQRILADVLAAVLCYCPSVTFISLGDLCRQLRHAPPALSQALCSPLR